MTEIKSYRLIAYDVATGTEVLNWPNYSKRYPVAGEVLINGSEKWEVVGVFSSSTQHVRQIDVRKLEPVPA